MIEAERGSWVLIDGRWVLKDQYQRQLDRAIEADRLRSDLPSPQIMRDIEPFVNVAVDGAEISSRSHKREMMKRHSLVEVGNDNRTPKRRKRSRRPVADDIKKAIQQLSSR